MTLNERHKKLLSSEFGVDDIDAISKKEAQELYESMCCIEEEEISEDEDSERGNLAADIVTYLSESFMGN